MRARQPDAWTCGWLRIDWFNHREKAQALIMAGEVLLNGQKALKPSQAVSEGMAVELTAKPRYVGAVEG